MYFLNNYLGGLKTEKMTTDIQTNISHLSNLTPYMKVPNRHGRFPLPPLLIAKLRSCILHDTISTVRRLVLFSENCYNMNCEGLRY
jgi:hypothetical protein